MAQSQNQLSQKPRVTWGHSMVVDPWGSILGCLPTGAGVLVVEVDLAEVKARRRQLPVHQHRHR